MVRNYCSVPNCDATKAEYQMFHTPKDPDLSWRWKKVVGSKENTAEWKHALICERHFDPSVSFEFYQKGKCMGKRKLVKGAMPTLHLPEYAVLNEIHNYAVANAKDGATQLIKIESYKPDKTLEPDFDDVVAPEKSELNKAALDAELAKAVAKNLVTKSMPKAKKNQILGRQDLVEKEAIKQLRDKINQLKEDKKNLQKESSNLDIKLRKLNKRQKTLTEKEKEALVESVLGKHFSRAQIRCYVRGNWQMSKLWEERDYKLALIIHTISKRCFHYLRNHQVLPMPSYTSLKKHTFDESTDVKTAMDVDALIQAAASSAGGVAMDTNQMDGEETTITVHEATGVEGGIPAGTQIVQLEDGSTVHIDPSALQMEGTQIHIDGQSYTVEGAPFTLEGAQQIQIAEGGQILTADGQVVSQDGITVMNVIDPSQLQELQAQIASTGTPAAAGASVVVDENGTPVAASGTTEAEDASAVQQVQYYVV